MHNMLVWYRINSTGRRERQLNVGASVVTKWFLFLCQESNAKGSQGHVKDSGNVVTPGDLTCGRDQPDQGCFNPDP